MQPIAVDDLVVHDGREWYTTLIGGYGLGAARPQTRATPGLFPTVSAVEREPRQLYLKTLHLQGTRAAVKAARRLLLRRLDPTRQLSRRLLVAEDHLPGVGPHVLALAFGPWDVRREHGGWAMRDLLRLVTGALDGDWSVIQGGGLVLDPGATTPPTFILAAADLEGVSAAEFWWKPDQPHTHPSDRYLLDGGDLKLYHRASDDKFVLTDGTNTVSDGTTFAADDELHVVARWGTAGLYLHVNGSTQSGSGAAVTLASSVFVGASASGAQCGGELLAVRFYTALDTAGVLALYGAGRAFTDARWLDVVCRAADVLAERCKRTIHGTVATLVSDGDQRWRARWGDYHAWSVTGGDQTETVPVATDDDVYPEIYITPIQAKAGGYQYRRWVPVAWKGDADVDAYPICIQLDTAALVTASKMQADGDDLRVVVDGVEADRWISGVNTTDTRVWVNLDFLQAVPLTLAQAIPASGEVSEIHVNEDTSALPETGILYVGSEAFTYAGKDDGQRRFRGVVRAVRGTTAGSHGVDDRVYWLQHDVWLKYGNPSATAPAVDDSVKPALDLAGSDNDVWKWVDLFGENDGDRVAQWQRSAEPDGEDPAFNSGHFDLHTGGGLTEADPWTHIGVEFVLSSSGDPYGSFRFALLPAVVKQISAGGRAYNANPTYYIRIGLYSSPDGEAWTEETYYNYTANSEGDWSITDQAINGGNGRPYVALGIKAAYNVDSWFDTDEVIATLDTDRTPDVTVGQEQQAYDLDVTLTNETLGEAVTIRTTINVGTTLAVNCDAHTAVWEENEESMAGAVQVVGDSRRDWLRLVDGDNKIRWQETGTVEVRVELVWDRRLME